MPTSIGQFIHDSAPLALAEQNQLGWIVDRQGPQQQRIHQTENRGIRADAKRKSEDRDGSKAGIPCQCAKAVANVHEKVFCGGPAPDLPAALLAQTYIAELPPSGGSSFFPGHALLDEFLDLFFQVLPNLIREIAVDPSTQE